MVGLNSETPQRGRNFGSAAIIAADFEALFHRQCVEIGQGRATPEKQLQSWLISKAYQNSRRMVPIEIAAASRGHAADLLFVTDEIPVKHPTKGKILCDLLVLRQVEDGTFRAVDMELKTSRAMTELVSQVEAYAEMVDRHEEEYQDLFSALLGQEVELSGPCEKWIVWPMLKGHECDPREDELADMGIRMVSYEQLGKSYRFHVGAPVEW